MSPSSIKVSPGQEYRVKWLYRAQNAIWLWLGAAAVMSLIAWLTDPAGESRRSALGRTLSGPLDEVWHLVLGVGGVLVFAGVWRLAVRLEVIGHLFVALGVFINALAVAAVVGAGPSAFILFGVAFASAGRIWYLLETSGSG